MGRTESKYTYPTEYLKDFHRCIVNFDKGYCKNILAAAKHFDWEAAVRGEWEGKLDLRTMLSSLAWLFDTRTPQTLREWREKKIQILGMGKFHGS